MGGEAGWRRRAGLGVKESARRGEERTRLDPPESLLSLSSSEPLLDPLAEL